MILRVDKLLTEIPVPSNPSPASAAAVQEVMGGKTGELSTLMNYLFQSNNFRGREAYRPYYDLVANIAAEEWGHVELVSHTINLLLTGATPRKGDVASGPLKGVIDEPYKYHFLSSGQAALPADSMGNWWNGSYVTNTGNLKLDLVHNFFLELGARATKARVYEMATDPTARELTAFLLVRGSTHVIAFAKALEKLSGVEVSKLFPIPELSTHQFPECRKYIEMGLYNTMYFFSPKDYRQLAQIWTGPHPDGAPDLVVSEDPIPTLADPPPAEAEPQLAAPAPPELEPGFLAEVAERIFGASIKTEDRPAASRSASKGSSRKAKDQD
jgi:Mn-containing catalase